PKDKSETGPAGEDARPGNGPHPRPDKNSGGKPGERPRNGPHQRPDKNSGRKPDAGPHPRPDKNSGGKPGERPRGAAAALIELDRDLMKLLVRRATLVSRIRGGRDHAAGPAAIQAEKAVRTAWESGALAFSKDPRFSRQLFSLLQDIKVMSQDQAREAGGFRLTPATAESAGNLLGPLSTRSAQMHLLLAAFLGRSLRLDDVALSAGLMDAVKLCSQAGAKVRREPTGQGTGSVTLASGAPLGAPDKSLYAGEDSFAFYLTAFFAAGKAGVWRFNGGPRLKGADLSSLRQTLPLFGARLAHVVPHSQGLPVNLECSGEIPPLVVVPPELPFEALCALLLAPLAWDRPLTLNLAALPASTATAALAEARPLHRVIGAEVETHGPHIVFNQAQLTLPEKPALPLDPALSAYLLAIPAFTGGGLTLRGSWPARNPDSAQAADLLAWAGLALADTGEAISVRALGPPFAMPLQTEEFSPQCAPLFLALAVLRQSLHPGRTLPCPLPLDDDDQDLAGEFLARLGLRYEEGLLRPGPDPAPEEAWTSPGPFWSLAFCLAAFSRPGLVLANPGSISEVMPSFWSIYNSLPEPADPARAPVRRQEENDGGRPARRRVIAD
ncbi:hypothetical protein LJC15_05260, partial [Desulfovibrio sp. OttesenSCG-928-G11]|nr:hypothetical protein [Desulfovibrio sp. OttesenSCG-928-G11]